MASYAFTLAEVSLLTVTVRRLIKHFNVISENDFITRLGNLAIISNESINRNSTRLLTVSTVYSKAKDRVGGLNLGSASRLME